MSAVNVHLAALSLAVSAIGGRVSPRDVAVLRGLAAEALPEAAPLRREIEWFARARQAAAGDPRRMGQLGKRLGRAVERARLAEG